MSSLIRYFAGAMSLWPQRKSVPTTRDKSGFGRIAGRMGVCAGRRSAGLAGKRRIGRRGKGEDLILRTWATIARRRLHAAEYIRSESGNRVPGFSQARTEARKGDSCDCRAPFLTSQAKTPESGSHRRRKPASQQTLRRVRREFARTHPTSTRHRSPSLDGRFDEVGTVDCEVAHIARDNLRVSMVSDGHGRRRCA